MISYSMGCPVFSARYTSISKFIQGVGIPDVEIRLVRTAAPRRLGADRAPRAGPGPELGRDRVQSPNASRILGLRQLRVRIRTG